MLMIPYALNTDNSVVYPSDARKGEHYFCPKCKAPVIVKQGDVRVHHFAHKSDTNCQGPESPLHSACIQAIANNLYVLSEALEQDDWLKIVDICSKCNRDFNHRYPNPHTYNDVRLEYKLLDSQYRADIALLQDGELAEIIEVYHTHRVDNDKWAFIIENKIPCLEVSAEKMKAYAPSLILPILKSNTKDLCDESRHERSFLCSDCEAASIPVPRKPVPRPGSRKPQWKVKPEYAHIPKVERTYHHFYRVN